MGTFCSGGGIKKSCYSESFFREKSVETCKYKNTPMTLLFAKNKQNKTKKSSNICSCCIKQQLCLSKLMPKSHHVLPPLTTRTDAGYKP